MPDDLTCQGRSSSRELHALTAICANEDHVGLLSLLNQKRLVVLKKLQQLTSQWEGLLQLDSVGVSCQLYTTLENSTDMSSYIQAEQLHCVEGLWETDGNGCS